MWRVPVVVCAGLQAFDFDVLPAAFGSVGPAFAAVDLDGDRADFVVLSSPLKLHLRLQQLPNFVVYDKIPRVHFASIFLTFGDQTRTAFEQVVHQIIIKRQYCDGIVTFRIEQHAVVPH